MTNSNKRAKRILAIDPGTREMGLAVLEEEALLYHGVKTFRRRKAAHELLREIRKAVLQVIDHFQPQVVVIEKTFIAYTRRMALLNVVADEIKALARKRKLKVFEYAPGTVKKFICRNGRASKEDVSKIIAAKYPELLIYVTQNRKWKERYWQNMFDAVALGITLDKIELKS